MQPAIRSQEVNPAKLAILFKKEFKMSNIVAGETVMCLTDLSTRREYVEATFAAAEECGADVYELCVNSVPSWTKVGVPTIGQCKGTLEAAKAADIMVIFHVPLFTRWLRDVREAGTRALMIIDGPDDLEQLMAPPGLKEAVVYADQLLAKTKQARVTNKAGTDLSYTCGFQGASPI